MARDKPKGRKRPSTIHIVCIVEGKGEMVAVPRLIERIAVAQRIPAQVKTTPFLASRGGLEQQNSLDTWVRAADRKIEGRGGILILFDSEGKCPVVLGRQALAWASRSVPDVPIGVVVAHQEYESWFLAGATGIAGVAGLLHTLHPPANPESFNDAKGWLRDHTTSRERYSPTTHQGPLTDRFDLREARSRADSFDKCYREVSRLLNSLICRTPSRP